MKARFFYILLVVLLGLGGGEVSAQCKGFVRGDCLPMLEDYIHDGAYQAVVLSPGEEAEIYKTVFGGQSYRLFVCTEDNVADMEFTVTDLNQNVLFSNKDNGNVMWDFKSAASQQLKVKVKIHGTDNSLFGCVGVLFGMKDK